ncbi:molybdopterin synthase catalytic subunit-like isoform X2 [Dendronephthya gigantea]|uniref:molybdopterin synthase catalytic subunit-like isoform X2 n=1 Tax=Dendronephthya gigantea TaxID=151771 RepID=UPI00106A6766|nr:molybdopterin synthase catalytic subunit-like isoform X2 [Dendronephthya gigantea]
MVLVFSNGTILLCLSSETSSLVGSPSAGATSIFVGTTRDTFNGKRVVRLEYEAYEPMAKKELAKICQDIHKKWNVLKIAIVHRIGLVPISEASVVIAISSVHRKESLEAVQYCIDTLKATVPIWKKEVYDDGQSTWKENSDCCKT